MSRDLDRLDTGTAGDLAREIHRVIDHTLLRPDATLDQVRRLLDNADATPERG